MTWEPQSLEVPLKLLLSLVWLEMIYCPIPPMALCQT